MHIVDTATYFSAAIFLDSVGESYGQSVKEVWMAFITTWCTMCIGFPNRLRKDQGFVLTSDGWKQLTDYCGIRLRLSGVRAYSSGVIGERYQAPLQRIYHKVRLSYPNLPDKFVFSVSINFMNDTTEENGLGPSCLVFETIPLPFFKHRSSISKRSSGSV